LLPRRIGLYILLGGITLFSAIVVILDGIAYRRRHRGHEMSEVF
jgi:hypothetical protein